MNKKMILANIDSAAGGFIGLVIVLLGIALFIMAILMPFFVFGIYNSVKKQENASNSALATQKQEMAILASQERILTATLEAQNNHIKMVWDKWQMENEATN